MAISIYALYCNLTAISKCNCNINYENIFNVTKDTSLGSIISPLLSTMFTSEPLHKLIFRDLKSQCLILEGFDRKSSMTHG